MQLHPDAQASYERNGFCLVQDVLAGELIPGAHQVMDRVVNAEYATGVEPFTVGWRPGDDPTRLVKIDQPQMADRAITTLLERSNIGRLAADLVGADRVQCWAVQQLFKPGTGTVTGNVGWHQDDDYWHTWWDGEVFTCWLALSDVTEDAGPMRFVVGSHEWGFLQSGSFFDNDMDRGQSGFPGPDEESWGEVPAVLGPGSGSFHHRRTIHGSGPNMSDGPRRSYAVHLRTERSKPLAAPDWCMDHIDDPDVSPVLFER